jgi:amino-acid N-acetyltransferase
MSDAGAETQATLMLDAAEFLRAVSGLVRISMFRDRDRISVYGVTVAEAHALDVLFHLGPIGLSQLAAELFVDKSTASRTVAGLEEKGYISRNIDRNDRRAVRLEVTPDGRELHEQIQAANLQEAAQLLRSFAGDTRQGMTARIRQVTRAFAVYAGVGDASVCLLPGESRSIPFNAEIRLAGSPDLQETLHLLEMVGMPTEGVRDHFLGGFVVGREPKNSELIGAAGVESYGAVGLLRSCAVHPSYRKAGFGRALLLAAENLAKVIGIRELYLIARMVQDSLSRRGWELVPHEEIPGVLSNSDELRSSLPTATVMRLRLDS